jgi:hypothetical protein
MNRKRKQNILIILGIIFISGFLYAATLHGVGGNPQAIDFKNNLDQATKPFELSPERGRFAHVYSLAEYGTYNLSPAWAEVVYPDVGVAGGKYFSFFAPGISYYSTPFYMVGKAFDLAQVFTFASISFLAIASLLMIYLIGRRIFDMEPTTALLAVVMFGFTSFAWSYSVTLYQHIGTVFLITSGLYAAWRFSQKGRYSFLWALYVGCAYGFSVMVDYPNALMALPVVLYLLYTTITVKEMETVYKFFVKTSVVGALIGFIILTGAHFYLNAHYFGSWKQLAGSIPSYTPPGYQPVFATATTSPVTAVEHEKNVAGFFKEQNIPQSSFVLLFSTDRGLFIYWPAALLSIIGIYIYRKKFKVVHYAIISLILINFLVYASWGDPWGGWAFGPRYLIPLMPWLALFATVSLSEGRRWVLRRVVASVFLAYSTAVSLLGVLTTNAVPPKFEAIFLPIKKYGYAFNVHFLTGGQSASYAYNSLFSNAMALTSYFFLLYLLLLIVIIWLMVFMPHHE